MVFDYKYTRLSLIKSRLYYCGGLLMTFFAGYAVKADYASDGMAPLGALVIAAGLFSLANSAPELLPFRFKAAALLTQIANDEGLQETEPHEISLWTALWRYARQSVRNLRVWKRPD